MLQVRQPLVHQGGTILGYIELSNGPAYGVEVLRNVMWGWSIASLIAVALAAIVGWRMSNRISQPLIQLTEATTRMTKGDLSTRTHLPHQDEFATLAITFNRMAEQVEHTVDTLQQFVSDAAHELHTPLTALRSNLELAEKTKDRAKQATFLAIAQNQIQRLENLTNNLLDLSRIDGQKQLSHSIIVNIANLLREDVEGYASQAEQRGISYHFHIPETTILVPGHKTHLSQILDNLIDNALKFTLEGGSIEVGLQQMDQEGFVSLWVADNGLGIPLEDRANLFNRFYRGKTVTNIPGNGLGLAIVKAIVEMYNGAIAVEHLNSGTKFVVRLPTLQRTKEVNG